MIQRIQSIYLFFAAAIAVAVCFIPIGDFTLNEMAFEYKAFKLTNLTTAASASTFYVGGLWMMSAILSLVSIFLYKNRRRQVKIVGINMLVMLAALIAMLYLYPNLLFQRYVQGFNAEMLHFNMWVLISLIPAACLFLANRAIRNDERKVRAADRIR